MMKMFTKLLLVTLCCFGCEAKPIVIVQETLQNGMKVIIVPIKSNGSVRFAVVYNVGTSDDPLCKVGLSHFLEHMMFKGTKLLPAEKITRILGTYSAAYNAWTSADYTCYWETCHRKFLKVFMKLEADRMVNLVLADKDVESEREVIHDERRYRCEENPQTRYDWDIMPRLLYLFSPYGCNGIGFHQHIAAYTKRALQKHYNKYYAPNNATMIVVGDITKEEVMKLAQETFGKLKRRAEFKRERVIDPVDLNVSYTMDRRAKDIAGKSVEIMYKRPSKTFNSLKKSMIAGMALDCLCNGARSLMYQKFVEDDKIFHSISGSYDFRQFDKAFVHIVADLAEKTDLREAEKLIKEYITNLLSSEEGLAQLKTVFEVTKKRKLNTIILWEDNPGTMFDLVFSAFLNDYSLEDASNICSIIESVTFEEVANWINENFKEKDRIVTLFTHKEDTE